MSMEVRLLKDKGTGESFVPVTHWDAVASRPDVVTHTAAGTILNSDAKVLAVIPVVDMTEDTGTTYELSPNQFYLFGTKGTLTITLSAGSTGILSEYVFLFTSGSTATTFSYPNTITWKEEPNILANKTYMISIVNNLGVIGIW